MRKPHHKSGHPYRREARGSVSAENGYPDRSWWTQGQSRETFRETAQQQEARLKNSKFGQATSPMLER